MLKMKKIAFLFGTRPEAIKLTPLILKFGKLPEYEVNICVTGQHREMLEQTLGVFGIKPDTDLSLMRLNQSLAALTSKSVSAINQYLKDYSPDLVFVQGDTTTTFTSALASYYNRIPICHIEAGLRTWNRYSPFPEEINRVLTSHIADYHFAPTETARNNLLGEGIDEKKIFVTGNTVIDALYIAIEKIRNDPPEIPGLPIGMLSQEPGRHIVLITGHRRENFGEGFESICKAIVALAGKFPDAYFIYPVHLNPNVREPVFKMLSGYSNIHLIEPLSYLPFISLMDRCTLILTDSGGLQEEAPSLGKPVLVMRNTTERPEAVDAGTVKLVGTDFERIVENVSQLLTDSALYDSMAKAVNPYGDGRSADRILSACGQILNNLN